MMIAKKCKAELVAKMTAARAALQCYSELRRAKGYMSVNEGLQLRETLLALCNDFRDDWPAIRADLPGSEITDFHRAIEAVASASLCLLSGGHDCPSYITVDASKLQACIDDLDECLNHLDSHAEDGVT
ncbi:MULTISPECIES: biofilm formation regulator BssR [Mangrovibacter]|uniref:Biofilm regulator BssR n=1 Tax=Mangrovibacter plantisponsor TaxID=451513 RepID=A0A317Q4B5_9ENTR|nr:MULTISPECIES: biofilm formation regulator BssR [Mangrovibacter]PWW10254.1 biofilm regulator BssR [Mangrovibacter plantisponsor]